jgi:hypothetical protein
LLSIWTFWTCFFPFCGCWVRETISCAAYSLQHAIISLIITDTRCKIDNNWYVINAI